MSMLLSLVLFAATAKVYRCEGDGEIVFQQSPCEMADEPVELRPESSFGQPAATVERRPPRPASARSPGIRGKDSAPKRDAVCETARSKRDAAYAKRGNTMTFDERRKLQDAIDEACGLR